MYANVDDIKLAGKRVRNRWYKMVTLVNNPSLVFERLMKNHRQEMESAGGDKDNRLRMKVTTYMINIK